MNISNPDINKIVKIICTKHGWPLWSTFSDKRESGTRRLKYMRNGWPVPADMKKKIKDEIARRIGKYTNVKEIYWGSGYTHGKGQYDFIAVAVKDTQKNLDPSAAAFVATEQKKLVDRVFSTGLVTYAYTDRVTSEVWYHLATPQRIKNLIKDYPTAPVTKDAKKTGKKVSKKMVEDLKTALGPTRIKWVVENEQCLIEEDIYLKLRT